MKSDQSVQGFGGSWWSWILFKKFNPLGTVKSISLFYGFFAILLAFLAVLTAVIYLPLQQYNIPYAHGNGCIRNFQKINQFNQQNNSRCQVSFQITKQMRPPIHFLYYVQNANVNHRNYLKSYSKKQLQGQLIDLKTAQSECKPFVFNKDMNKTVSWSGKPLDPNGVASPCGFKAYLFFNDTFKIKKINSDEVTNVSIQQPNIRKIQGIGIKFKSRNADQQWISPQDNHFMNLMQDQALMTKKKLWGTINSPLKPGRYSLIVQNNYKINRLKITKGIQLTQSSKLGGRSRWIPIILGICSIGCAIYAIGFYKKFHSLQYKLQDE